MQIPIVNKMSITIGVVIINQLIYNATASCQIVYIFQNKNSLQLNFHELQGYFLRQNKNLKMLDHKYNHKYISSLVLKKIWVFSHF